MPSDKTKAGDPKPEKPASVRPLPEMAERLVDLEARVAALEADKAARPH